MMIMMWFSAAMALPMSLPVVKSDLFHVGKEWVWEYRDAQGEFYSAEKYTVIAKQGARVIFEMATQYKKSDRPSYYAHHRIQVDVNECLKAYAQVERPRPWQLKMWYFDGQQWVSYDNAKTLPFEEKFNCDPHVRRGSHGPVTEFDQIPEPELVEVFQQRTQGRDDSSWYALRGPLAGVAMRKLFPHAPGSSGTYSFRLVSAP